MKRPPSIMRLPLMKRPPSIKHLPFRKNLFLARIPIANYFFFMRYDSFKHHRRSIRLKGYDYSSPGAYYVTICTRNREIYLQEFPELHEIVERQWQDIPNRYPNVELDEYVIMPNHLHGIIIIKPHIETVGAGLAPALDKNPTLDKTPALDKNPTLNKTPALDEMSVLDETPVSHKKGRPQESPLPLPTCPFFVQFR